ncbi:MAG: hypothetical protein KDA60_09805 [Planctomycetales bacterium]|nr:hypothetical protein [Planctomycetales bacterium]
METSLHRELKRVYAGSTEQTEIRLGRYRIDAVRNDELIEIQHGSLSAIRDKIQKLTKEHAVRVVKPIVARKRLIRLNRKNGKVVGERLSPKRGSLLDMFAELVYFTRTFPHPNLTIEFALVEVDELRYPGHGRRRWRRKNDHIVQDRRLVGIQEQHTFHTAADLTRVIPGRLPRPFHTGHLAEALNIPRPDAQRIAYCFRKMGTAKSVGKQGNAILYELI